MNGMLPTELQPIVAPDERVLWTGRAGSVGPGVEGIFGGCFGLFFAGFALFWIAGAATIGGVARGGFDSPGAPGGGALGTGLSLFPLFGVPFLLVGLGVIFSSLYWSPRRKSSGIYAITDRRLLFVRTFPKTIIKEIPLSPHLRIEQTLDANGSGTLAFLDPVSVHDPEGITVRRGRYGSGSAYRSENPYTFHRIPDAAQVAHLVQNLVRR